MATNLYVYARGEGVVAHLIKSRLQTRTLVVLAIAMANFGVMVVYGMLAGDNWRLATQVLITISLVLISVVGGVLLVQDLRRKPISAQSLVPKMSLPRKPVPPEVAMALSRVLGGAVLTATVHTTAEMLDSKHGGFVFGPLQLKKLDDKVAIAANTVLSTEPHDIFVYRDTRGKLHVFSFGEDASIVPLDPDTPCEIAVHHILADVTIW